MDNLRLKGMPYVFIRLFHQHYRPVGLSDQLKTYRTRQGTCPACEDLRNRALETISPADAFERAAYYFMQLRAVTSRPGAIAAKYVRANTEKAYVRHTKSLTLFFAGMTVERIGW
jgi:hypothetical protein